MIGMLHALVEDAAREAGVSVAAILDDVRKPIVLEARQMAMLRAADEGYSREQIGRVFKRTKRSVVRAIRRRRISPVSTLSTCTQGQRGGSGHDKTQNVVMKR